MKKYVLFCLFILLAGVVADVPGCWEPSNNQLANGAYTLGSMFGESNTSAYTYNYTGAEWNSTNKARVGAVDQVNGNDLSFIMGVQWQDAALNRGFGVLFGPDSLNHYYSVFQYNGAIYGIPNLRIEYQGGTPFYTTCVDDVYFCETGEAVFFEGNNTLKILEVRIHQTDGLGGLTALHFGDGNYTYGSNIDPYTTVVQQGNITSFQGIGGLARVWMNTTVGYDTGGWERVWGIPNTGGNFDKWTGYHYFGCSGKTGAKTVVAWEGSETCNNMQTLDQITCSFTGPRGSESCTISAGSNTTVATSTLYPSYRDAVFWGDFQLVFPPMEYGGHSCMGAEHAGEQMAVSKPTKTSRETNYMMTDNNNPNEWINEILLGFAGQSSRTITGDVWVFNVLRLNSPTGNIADVPLATLNFDTNHQNTGLSCKNEWGNVDYWNATFVLGVNATWWKNSWLTCEAGVLTTGSKYANTTQGLDALLSATEQYRITRCSGWLVSDYLTPVWKDEASNTINRFSYAFFNVSNGSAVPTYSFMVDDTWYEMNYTYTAYEPQTCQITDNPYGNYTYQCEEIDGYYTEESLVGWFTLNETNPTFALTLEYQRKRDLYLNITITQDGMNLENIICASDYGAASTNNGVCSIFLGENPNINVTVTFPNLPEYPQQQITFPIGDYYNSQGYGIGGKCIDFTGYYEYSFDVRDVQKQVRVHTISEKNTDIGNTMVYLDGDAVCTTDGTGWCVFPFNLDFNVHTLTGEKNNYFNGTWRGTIYDNPVITIKLASRSGMGDIGSVSDSTGFLSLVKNRAVMSLMLVAGAATAGAGYAGIPGAVAIGIIMSVLCTVLGWLDWYVMVFLVVALSLIGALAIRDMMGGK